MDPKLIRLLRQAERRLRWQRSLRWSSTGLSVGLALSIGLAMSSRLVPALSLSQLLVVEAMLTFVAALFPALYVLTRRYKPLYVARIVDRRAGLKERLSTAIELAETGAHTSLAIAQRANAEETAARLQARAVAPFSFSRKMSLIALGLLVVLAASTLLPNPMHTVLEERAATAKAVKEERAKIEQVRREIVEASQLGKDDKQEELLRALEQLDKELASPALSGEEALAKISAAEDKLAKLLDRTLPAERLGLEQLAKGLQSLSRIDPSLQAGASAKPEMLGEDLARLSEKLAGLDETQRNNFAEALSKTASAISSSNPGLATELAKTADALRTGDATKSGESLERAADELREMERRLADQRSAEKVLTQLQASRVAIARSGTARGGSFVRSPQGSGSANSAGSAQSGQSGNPSGSTGSSPGGGSSTNPGSGTGAPSGSGNVAGTSAPTSPGAISPSTGQPATGRPGTTGVGAYESVYSPGGIDSEGKPLFLPGQADAGEMEPAWLSTRPGGGSSVVPYSEVFQGYSDAAARSLDSGYVPANLKEYVRTYFTSLEPTAKD